MKLNIQHQENYSRGELLLRSFFGFLYIYIPHGFMLIFVGIASLFLSFIAWWAILFTGKHPKSFFDFQVGVMRWSLRLSATQYNLLDGYPAFGVSAVDERITFEVTYPETLSRGTHLLKSFFGILYCTLPHGFLLMFRMLGCAILSFLAWWVVLFTGKYPISWHKFIVDTLRWQTRVNLYMGYMSDVYPPFSGRE